ncbi:hypothetical protein J6590_067276 [Homalodisca vitripennis]|nr:hypothetical protein J6590_067276 [Homalodisca vitripennis]
MYNQNIKKNEITLDAAWLLGNQTDLVSSLGVPGEKRRTNKDGLEGTRSAIYSLVVAPWKVRVCWRKLINRFRKPEYDWSLKLQRCSPRTVSFTQLPPLYWRL